MTTPTAKESPAFRAGCVLLVLAILLCGVFAGLAGQEIGNKDVDFGISFGFLGIVVVLIFGLAWLDSSTKTGDHNFMAGHGH